MIRKVKPEIRVVGFDDGTFSFSSKLERRKTVLFGVVMKGSKEVVGAVSRWITVDGTDATEKLIDAVNESRFKDLRVVMLKGITYGGFNVVDLERLHRETGLPVIVVVRTRPDLNAMELALRKHFPDWEERVELLRKAPPLFEMIPGKLYVQALGVSPEVAFEVVRVTTKTGLIPEPLRLAHIMASAFMTGESTKE
ncbi:endonuclease dU [Thermococcus prieurii]